MEQAAVVQQESAGETAAIVTSIPQEKVEATKLDAPVIEQPKKEDDKWAPKFAALTKKERDLQLKERGLKEREAKYSEYEKLKASAKENPLDALSAIGLTYEEVTDYLLTNDPKQTSEVRSVRKEVQALKDALEKEKTEKAQLDQTAKLDAYKHEQKEHILKQADKYELLNSTGRYDLVFEVVNEWHDKHQKVLTHDEAAEMVEKYLDDEVSKYLKLKKVQAKMAAKEPEKSDKQESVIDKIVSQKPSNTLTNNMTQGTVAADKPRSLSREESIERAAAKIRWL